VLAVCSKSDVYSFALLFWTILRDGQLPYLEIQSLGDLIEHVAEEPIGRPSLEGDLRIFNILKKNRIFFFLFGEIQIGFFFSEPL
jgi:hypothetical protein